MEFCKTYFEEEKVNVTYSRYGDPGVNQECHLLFSPDSGGSASFDYQLENMNHSLGKLLKSDKFSHSVIVMKRYFMSDAANQYSTLKDFETNKGDYAFSAVQQPLLNGSKVAMWVYIADGLSLNKKSNYISAERNGYKHLWAAQMHGEGITSYDQTTDIFTKLEDSLFREDCSLKEHCIRTWLFVHNVDLNYCGVVEARKAFFQERGMVPKTHYISSTGIEGRNNNPLSLVIADSYSVKGIKDGQVKFLKASSHMNPTYEYGVTFERGTIVDYGDRRHILISGTASINTKGEIVHPNDVLKQAQRAMQNVEALLTEASANSGDIAQMIIYLRDIADYKTVETFFDATYGSIPKVIVLAPVCRPGWLVEIECMAIAKHEQPQFQNF